MSGTPEQRLELACHLWDRRLGLSSEAILRTLIQGSDSLVGDPGWMSHGRPYDWGDLSGNLETLAWLPAWAKPQTAEIIRESIELVYANYSREDERTAAYAYVNAALADADCCCIPPDETCPVCALAPSPTPGERA